MYLIECDAQHAVGRCYYQLALLQNKVRIQHRAGLLLPHSYLTTKTWHKLEELYTESAATVSSVSQCLDAQHKYSNVMDFRVAC